MRRVARISLAVTLLLGALMALPARSLPAFVPAALAQIVPTPTVPDLLPGDPDQDGDGVSDEDDNCPKKKNANQRDVDKDEIGDVCDPRDNRRKPGGDRPGPGDDDGRDRDGNDRDRDGSDRDGRDRDGSKRTRDRDGRKKQDRATDDIFFGTYRPSGSYSTTELVAVAAHLRSLGTATDDVIGRVFSPFIIGGNASWSNTWGAPRFGPAPGQVRTHQGQDVFCDYGAPVLATEDGTVEFAEGGLGGRVARLYRADGSYWYYAHLADWNTAEFDSGDAVQTGDVIGFCGNSGNALTTPPHVHFGWYLPSGKAKNPHRHLVSWLHQAQDRMLGVVSKATTQRVEQIDHLTLARRFGDGFMPDTSQLAISADSLLVAQPSTGTFTLAETALRAALSSGLYESGAASLKPATADDDLDAPMAATTPDAALVLLASAPAPSANELSD